VNKPLLFDYFCPLNTNRKTQHSRLSLLIHSRFSVETLILYVIHTPCWNKRVCQHTAWVKPAVARNGPKRGMCFPLSQDLIGLLMMWNLDGPFFFPLQYLSNSPNLWTSRKSHHVWLECYNYQESAKLLIPSPIDLHVTSYRGHFSVIRRVKNLSYPNIALKVIILFSLFYSLKSDCSFFCFTICQSRVDM